MPFIPTRAIRKQNTLMRQGFHVDDTSRVGQLALTAKHYNWQAQGARELGKEATAKRFKSQAKKTRTQFVQALKSRRLTRVPVFANEIERVTHLAAQQNPKTGAWADTRAPFWVKVSNTVDIISQLNRAGVQPKYPLRFLDSISTTQGLKKYLHEILYSYNIGNRKELNVGVTSLPIFYESARNFHHFAPGWREEFLRFFKEWQNPKTGAWGTWIKRRGQVVKLDDLSMTFHNVARIKKLGGKISHPRKIIETIWRMREGEYPYGWKEGGHYSSHHNFDVARLFSTFYNKMSQTEKERTRKLFEEFLFFGLKKCMSKNGAMREFGETTQTPSLYGTAFGTLMLSNIGYFRRKVRENVFGKTKLPPNSFRIYRGKAPLNEFDTTNLVGVSYATREATLDPLEARHNIAQYLAQTREHDPIHRGMIIQSLELDTNPTTQIQKLTPKRLAELRRQGLTIVPIDKFGGIVKN
ncbi:MAG: hypothetical protein WCW13_03280 [archaeon]|jgi:hypothetical protein